MSTTTSRRRRTVVLAALAATAGAAGLACLVVQDRVEDRVADRVRCHLPDGVEVAEVALGTWAPVAAVTRDAGAVEVVLEVDQAALRSLLGDRPRGALSGAEVGIAGGDLSVDLPGTPLPASVVLEPGVEDGEIVLTPELVRIGQRSIDPELLGPGAAGSPRAPLAVPGPDLPDGAELVDVSVVDDRLAVRVSVDGDADAPTTCP